MNRCLRKKDADAVLPETCTLGDRSNMAYSSSIVIYGRGTGVVIATGMNTEVGNIAGMLDNQDELDTPLKRKLNAVGKILTICRFDCLYIDFCDRCNLSTPFDSAAFGCNIFSHFHYSGGSAGNSNYSHGFGGTTNGKEKCLDTKASCC